MGQLCSSLSKINSFLQCNVPSADRVIIIISIQTGYCCMRLHFSAVLARTQLTVTDCVTKLIYVGKSIPSAAAIEQPISLYREMSIMMQLIIAHALNKCVGRTR